MLELLIKNGQKVLYPGPTGTGKSVNTYSVLEKSLGEEY